MNRILDRLGFMSKYYGRNGLDMEIDVDGSNLSAGEKQLGKLCSDCAEQEEDIGVG